MQGIYIPSGSSDSVKVSVVIRFAGFVDRGQVEVDDDRDLSHVDAARAHVRRDQDFLVAPKRGMG